MDFDNVLETELEELKRSVNSCPYTLASFISPSGQGLKVFSLVDSNACNHTDAYIQVANYYRDLTGIEYDSKCKDITRLCFVSYDPELFYNEDAKVFRFEKETQPAISGLRHENFNNSTTFEILDECLKFTEKKESPLASLSKSGFRVVLR